MRKAVIDRFVIPNASREEFFMRGRITRKFIRGLPGLVSMSAYSREEGRRSTSSPSRFGKARRQLRRLARQSLPPFTERASTTSPSSIGSGLRLSGRSTTRRSRGDSVLIKPLWGFVPAADGAHILLRYQCEYCTATLRCGEGTRKSTPD